MEISCILAVYADDILISGTKYNINLVIRLINEFFKIKDIGEIDFMIGNKFEKREYGYILHQKGYIKEILSKLNIDNLKPIKNPNPIEDSKLRKISCDEMTYRSAIGNLLYLAICTRPDILISVSKAFRRSMNPNMEDWENVIKIFRYLKGTLNYGILFTKGSN